MDLKRDLKRDYDRPKWHLKVTFNKFEFPISKFDLKWTQNHYYLLNEYAGIEQISHEYKWKGDCVFIIQWRMCRSNPRLKTGWYHQSWGNESSLRNPICGLYTDVSH